MQVEASIRLGTNAIGNKQGLWPAFWMLGDSMRHGTQWPQCGEIDIFEQVNGQMTGYGTIHCGTYPGGPCGEPNGKGGHVGLSDDGWHTWTVRIDRTAGDWKREVIYWLLDGAVYFSVTGAQVGDQAVWATLAHSPMYIILNVAVGGNWYVVNLPNPRELSC
jgi:beta-glucanase (GH16 family)